MKLPKRIDEFLNRICQKATIRTKVRFVMVWAFLFGAIINFCIIKFLIYPNFLTFEKEQAAADSQRIVASLQEEINHVDLLCRDWATWDDTYDFIVSRSDQFIKSNLEVESFTGNNINLIYFVNTEGRVVWGEVRGADPATILTLPEIPSDVIPVSHPLINYNPDIIQASGKSLKGVYSTEVGPLLVSSWPILTSGLQGPARGHLIMGRFLNDDLIVKLQKQVLASFKILPASAKNTLSRFSEMVQHKGQGQPWYVEFVNDEMLNMYSEYPAITGDTAFVLKLIVAREINNKGIYVARYSQMSLLVSLLVILISISLILRKLVSIPIANLTHHVLNVKLLGDLKGRLSTSAGRCSDEIRILAAEFNGMLDRIESVTGDLQEANKKLETLASIDSLTKTYNRRIFDEHLKIQWRLMHRMQKPLALILCDVDHFKWYNDTYGHQEGDVCLQKIAGIIQNIAVRPYDLVARYGGEEFAVILPEAKVEYAMILAEKMREKVLELKILHEKSPVSPYVSVSFGVACMVPSGEHTVDDLFLLSDKSLYMAKAQGRNRSVVLDEDELEKN